MTSPERLTVSRPEDILGFIPHVLGYWPEESLVAMTMQGKTLGATLRVDLPPPGPKRTLACFANSIRDYLEADDLADGVLIALFTEVGWDDGTVSAKNEALLQALRDALELAGMAVRDAWLVGTDYWRSAFCDDANCCPSPGRPTSQIRDSRLNAEMVYRGSTVREAPGANAARGTGRGASGGTATGLAGTDTTLKPLVGRELAGEALVVLEAEQRYTEQLQASWRNPQCFEIVLDAWQHAAVPGIAACLDAEALGFLRATLHIPSWRDAVVVMAAAGRVEARKG